MTSVRLELLALLACCGLFAAPIQAEKILIRTFVNGVPETAGTVRDLHIDVSQDLRSVTVVSGQRASFRPDRENGPGPQDDQDSPRTVDIDFAAPIKHGESVAVRMETAAGSLAVTKWWWTDAAHAKVARPVSYQQGRRTRQATVDEYQGWMRGDEPVLPYPLPKTFIDPYAIFNKRHHFGGSDRAKREVCVELDIRGLLRRIPDGLQAAAVRANVEGAARQWATCSNATTHTQVPRPNGDNANHGARDRWLDPPVMAPGPSHGNARGETFRSLTERECDAALLKYRCGLRIMVRAAASDPGCAAPRPTPYRGPAGCAASTASDGAITAGWSGSKGMPRGALGYGPPSADPKDPQRTASGQVRMRRQLRSGRWATAADRADDGDDWITNQDPDIPDDAYDFYSIFKHELGHVLCFSHAGSNYFEQDREARFADPQPLQPGLPDAERPFPSGFGHADPDGHGWVYYAGPPAEDGADGRDLWRAAWTGDGWVLEPLGPPLNGPADEVDPVLASDGTTLLFSSNRGGHYTLFEAVYDGVAERWSNPAPIPWSLEWPANQRGATLAGDMRTLYFASDASIGALGADVPVDDPGRAGDWNLWASEWVPGQGWSPPFALDDRINTPADETAPAVSGDGRMLYFASDRPGGAGGLDLYRSGLTNAGWSVPEPMTALNGAADDHAPATRPDDAYLMFQSGRDGSTAVYLAPRRTPALPPLPTAAEGGLPRWLAAVLWTGAALLVVWLLARVVRPGR
jgi:hypothetical protein